MPSASWGLSALNSSTKASNLACCCKLFIPDGLVVSFFKVRCMRSLSPVLLRVSGLDAFDGDAQAEPPDRELRQIEQGIGAGEGNSVIRADTDGEPTLGEQPLEGGKSQVFAR